MDMPSNTNIAYQVGYKDGLNGRDQDNPFWNPTYNKEYNKGYTKGKHEAIQYDYRLSLAEEKATEEDKWEDIKTELRNSGEFNEMQTVTLLALVDNLRDAVE